MIKRKKEGQIRCTYSRIPCISFHLELIRVHISSSSSSSSRPRRGQEEDNSYSCTNKSQLKYWSNIKAEQSWNKGAGQGDYLRLLEGKLQKPVVRETSGSRFASVSEARGLHVVAGPVCQAPRTREQGQAFCFLQHNLQLLEVLQPSHVLVLNRKDKSVEIKKFLTYKNTSSLMTKLF